MKKILKKFTWKQVIVGIVIFIFLKIVGKWGWAQDFYSGLFIALAIFIYNMFTNLRKAEQELEEFDKCSKKKKKTTIILVFIFSGIGTLFLIPIIINFTIPMFGIAILMIKTVFKFFSNPALEHILFLCVGFFQVMINFLVTSIFLIAVAFIWAFALDFRDKKMRHS